MSDETTTEQDVTNATIESRVDVHGALCIIKVRPDEGEVPEFVPGQFATLGLPKPVDPDSPLAKRRDGKPRLVRRAYSIASSPAERDAMEFYIVRVDGGKLTPRLFSLEPGERVFLDPRIAGDFTLDDVPDAPNKDIVLVSTGTGLAPYVAMLRFYRERPTRPWRRCVVIHGARLAEDLGYRDELIELTENDDSVQYIASVTREPEDSDWPGLRGRVDAIMEPVKFKQLTGVELDPEHCHVFLCGNPAMIDSVEESLKERGFTTHTKKQAGNIHFERYW